MNPLIYFNQAVLPALPDEQVIDFFAKYPRIQLSSGKDLIPVAELPVMMLVALTGTGKTTTLNALKTRADVAYEAGWLPSRRDLANFIIIPTAQYHLGHTIQPVQDRERRFFYTRTFAGHFAGGMAAVYANLYSQPTTQVVISEGVRGHDEIAYVLAHCPRWQVLELSIDLMTRLERLSARREAFDLAAETDDLSFLPASTQARVQQLLVDGAISTRALTITRAEAKNYSLAPYAQPHPRYHLRQVDGLQPAEIAAQIVMILTEMME